MFKLALITGLLVSLLGHPLLADEPASAPLVGVTINDWFLKQLQFTQYTLTPFFDQEEGRWVTPRLTTTMVPRLGNRSDSALLHLDIGIRGTASTVDTQPVGPFGRRTVTVAVDTTVTGDYTQDLSFNANGLQVGQLWGGQALDPQIAWTSNNFRLRLFNRMVGRVTQRLAVPQIQARIPFETAKANRKTSRQINEPMSDMATAVEKVLYDARRAVPDFLPDDVTVKFSSQPGSVHMRVQDTSGKNRGAPPVSSLSAQAAVQTIAHEDIINQAFAHGFAGKELRLDQLPAALCGIGGLATLDFCQKKMPEAAKNIAVDFDKTEPLHISFRNGKIQFRLNAVFRRLRCEPPAAQPGVPPTVFQTPCDPANVNFQSSPFAIEFAYRIENGGLTLDKFAVEGRAAPRPGSPAKSGTHSLFPSGTFDLGLGHLSMSLADVIIKDELEKMLKGALKPTLSFDPISVPTRVSMVDTQPVTIEQAGSFVPLEVRAENGWLKVVTGFCNENMYPLGIMMGGPQTANGIGLMVSEVYLDSPAALQGFRPGDQIETFGVPGERATTFTGDSTPFSDLLRERAKSKDFNQRVVEISGRSANGQAFRRTVSLCPTGVAHRQNAAELLKMVK